MPRVSPKSVSQVRHAKSVFQECHAKSVSQDCLPGVSCQEYAKRELRKQSSDVSELNLEEAEDAEDRKVETQLKVGLKEVILDGLQVALNSIQVDLSSEADLLEAPLLRLSALQTFPCSVRGDKINRPQDVYEFCDPCARLFRLVQIDGLRLAALSHKPGSDDVLAFGYPDVLLPAMSGFYTKPGAVVEVIGQVTVQVEQRRWCGFIPQHRSRRVCPFSSETSISVRLPSVALQLQLEPIMALCEVLIHLIKSGMTAETQNEVDEVLSPSPEQVSDAISWSEAQQGSAGATGLQWREQLLRRK
eukprot:s2414_g1.t1